METSVMPINDKPHSDPGAKPLRDVRRHPEFFFEDTLIAIQIEDTLFNVHKYQLIKSEVFSDMFKLPRGEGELGEGFSPEHPIVMEGVTASDFEALLKVLYVSPFSRNHQIIEPLVVPAFRLANMWNFEELRAYLLPFAEGCLSDADKIEFARQFGIDEWLAPAHIRLCQRDEHLTTEEARKLGVDSVLLISRMREQYRKHPPNWPFDSEQYYCESCTGFRYIQKGYNFICIGCGDFGNGYLRCSGPGALVPQDTRCNHAKLQAEVSKWVEGGCVMKDS
ncbi:BTB/POZ domain protein [Rhizoctonia solani 123E]|uniref:BTB/POZ domain protein n=1 Tax=Rhizoctonia solani 123E TaxID=1423351 RepID=A0A074RN06_9AGAM|nr:BTB/POZ domain protein [Rhizoctonia solani 123E]